MLADDVTPSFPIIGIVSFLLIFTNMQIRLLEYANWIIQISYRLKIGLHLYKLLIKFGGLQ